MRHTNFIRTAVRSLLAATISCAALQAQAVVEGTWGNGGSPTVVSVRAFDLYTGEGHISAADGQQIYMWGYTDRVGYEAGKPMQYPGPTLKARVGETVRVTLHNRLPVRTSLMFPGQVLTTGGALVATPFVLTQAADAAGSGTGATQIYEFTATQPGTYLYQSGSDPSLQAEMGLSGALVIYPAESLTTAYGHPATAFDRENLFVVTEIDSAIHAAVDERISQLRAINAGCLSGTIPPAGCTGAIQVDLSKRFPDYWFLNGRTSPDVFAGNAVEHLPLQPYNALPRVHPGEKILLRMVGASNDLHPMHHHGNNSWAIARDGRMLSTNPGDRSAAGPGPNLAVSDYTIPIVPGQTYDAIWSWTGKGIGWDMYGRAGNATYCNANNTPTGAYPSGSTQDESDKCKPIPVKLPSELELAYGEFYSGSPYLGGSGLRPVGAGAANTTGAFFHIFHSHNEREIVNGGVFIGGMMTMLVIEPFSVTID